MGKKNRKNDEGGFVYSTGNGGGMWDDENEQEDVVPSEQLLYVSIDRKQRKGKEVTLIEGFQGADDSLSGLAKLLKSKCGTGGTSKDGQILIQGNFRDKIIGLLETEGYKVKRKGG